MISCRINNLRGKSVSAGEIPHEFVNIDRFKLYPHLADSLRSHLESEFYRKVVV